MAKKVQKILVYNSVFNKRKSSVALCGEDLWLTQVQIALLFNRSVREVNATLNELFAAKELRIMDVNKLLEIQSPSGGMFKANFYNLDAIIAVGYRLCPKEATHFHIWSMQVLRSHIVQSLVDEEYSIMRSIKYQFSKLLSVA